ncbi:hypothetical protein AVEN_49482-1 [Araneus ventricosus]|uniref:Uncharacterized protein n=1 Tax=Araneus ventricosus TaxID=182803 RepID=A0A4Y2C0Y0_ARAVE|nr:hypothetical protein AVEN_49482-1 [Araneus ventricosus]
MFGKPTECGCGQNVESVSHLILECELWRNLRSRERERSSAYLLRVPWRFCLIVRDRIRAYLLLEVFKSANEEHVYSIATKSPSMLIDLFVTFILESLSHPTLKDWVSDYLLLRIPSNLLMRNLSIKLQQNSNVNRPSCYMHFGDFAPLYPDGVG